ncbi:MFS transporter [Cohnella candidum]|nr:MFS transporter [Cohnella candidum]
MVRKMVFLALAMFSLGTDLFVIGGVLPKLAQGLSVSAAAAGQLVTVFAVTYAVTAPFLSAMAGKYPRKPVMIGAITGFALANLGSAFAVNFAMLLGMRVLAALCAATFSPSLPATAAQLAPAERRGAALAIVNGGLPAALVAGAPLGTWIGQVFGWRWSFLLVFALTITAAVSLWLTLPQLPRAETALVRRKLSFAVTPAYRGGWAVSLGWIIATYELQTYLPQILSSLLKMDAERTSLVLLMNGIASVVGIVLGGLFADRWKPVSTIRYALLLMAASFLIMPFAVHSAIGFTAVVLLWGIGHWGFYPSQQHQLVSPRPTEAGTILAFNSSVVYFGQAIGAGLGGLVYASGGSGIEIAWISAGAALLALAATKTKLYITKNGGMKHDDSIAA